MKKSPVVIGAMLVFISSCVFAGERRVENEGRPPEILFESAQLFGVKNQNDYHVAPQILSLALRPFPDWTLGGMNIRHQILLSGIAVPILHGPEDLYIGGALRGRFILGEPEGVWAVYMDAGGGVGSIDSENAEDSQGQDLTFNILASIGVKYRLNDSWTIEMGVLYQHWSNMNLSEPERPNVGLDAVGPVFGVSYRF